jgi:hypothetical protein
MNELIKKHAVTGSTLALAIAMGLQTFVFGSNDMQTLKQQVGVAPIKPDNLVSHYLLQILPW